MSQIKCKCCIFPSEKKKKKKSHPKTKKRNLRSVEGAVPGCGRCSEDAKQEESEGLRLHPHCLFSEALMD